MANYKFKTDVPAPTDDEIGKHKDFSKLRGNYESVTTRSRVPLYKNKKAFLVLVLIVIVAFLMAELLEEKKKENHQQKEQPPKHETN